jgi:GNAT superfamily N-acetyltransferase
VTIRDGGGEADTQWLLGLFDEAVEWMVARGQSGQWGTEPFSGSPRRTAMVEGMVDTGGLRVAELDGEAVAALVVGIAPLHVPPPDAPELYINLLLSSRRHAGKRLGTALVHHAVDEARERDAHQVRVDCWAGAPTLVRWYRDQGFVPTDTFDVDGWHGQIFTMRLAGSGTAGAAGSTDEGSTDEGSTSEGARAAGDAGTSEG